MATGAKSGKVKSGTAKVSRAAKRTAGKAEATIGGSKGLSPDPMTNLVIADVALRGGGRLLRHLVERTLLGVKYPPDKARALVKGRSMTRTLVSTACARIATRSVPGALVIGGGLLARTLYDRRRRGKATAEGRKAVDDLAADGADT